MASSFKTFGFVRRQYKSILHLILPLAETSEGSQRRLMLVRYLPGVHFLFQPAAYREEAFNSARTESHLLYFASPTAWLSVASLSTL